MLNAIMLAAAMTVSPPTPAPTATPTPTPTTSPTPAAAPTSTAPTAGATISPKPAFPRRDASGIITFVYDPGIAQTVYCAPGSECAIQFEPGELVKRTVTLKGPEDSVWSIQPSNPDEDGDPKLLAHVYVAPLISSPPTSLFIETTKRFYTLLLKPDPSAVSYVYAFTIPDETNTVTLPIQIDRSFKYGVDAGNVTPIACPAHGYNVTTERDPTFRPTNILIADGTVRLDFAPGTPLPSVGAPTRDIRDVDNLTMLPTTPDFTPTRRSIVVLACYPTITLFMNTNKGRAAVILQSY
jgi:hypothetical protein